MKIQVLGSGCNKCKKLFELTKEAASQLNLDITVEYVTDVSKIIEMGVMSSPVLAIDGKPAIVGLVPNIEQIKQTIILGQTAQKKTPSCRCKNNK